ncbi:MAG: hypothetical protein COC17_01700 [Hyphomicrobiales bacterium]|nr:MAG: hypothetical protein COC17_02185 [Hyphomicrobiales bacterium]PCH51352.1 MAG: hypothetical protein COC17_01700 [Hyphomicrobiales bacterium]
MVEFNRKGLVVFTFKKSTSWNDSGNLRRAMCTMSLSAVMCAALIASVGLANAKNLKPVHQNHKTYLINGLASVMPFVGYGFNNLKKKLGQAKHYSYATPVEGTLVVQMAVFSEIKKAYKKDPSININLVGISYGGNIVTRVASMLKRENIPVNYLAVLDGPVLSRIPDNVHRVDNFVCRLPGCMGQKVRLTKTNETTLHTEFKYKTFHIGLGDDERVHKRIQGQLTDYALNVTTPDFLVPDVTDPGIDYTMTASIK